MIPFYSSMLPPCLQPYYAPEGDAYLYKFEESLHSVEFPVTYPAANVTQTISIAPGANASLAIPAVCATVFNDSARAAQCEKALVDQWAGFVRRPCFANVAKADLIDNLELARCDCAALRCV